MLPVLLTLGVVLVIIAAWILRRRGRPFTFDAITAARSYGIAPRARVGASFARIVYSPARCLPRARVQPLDAARANMVGQEPGEARLALSAVVRNQRSAFAVFD